MFSYEFDFNGLRRLLIMVVATIAALVARNVWAFAVLIVAGYFALEAHGLYAKAKAYDRLSGHIKKAVKA